jgi:hypothetical protein
LLPSDATDQSRSLTGSSAFWDDAIRGPRLGGSRQALRSLSVQVQQAIVYLPLEHDAIKWKRIMLSSH